MGGSENFHDTSASWATTTFVIVLFLLAFPVLCLGDGGLRWNRICRVNFIDHIWHTPAIS